MGILLDSLYKAVSVKPKLQCRAQEVRDAKSMEHLPKMFITVNEVSQAKELTMLVNGCIWQGGISKST